MEPGFLNREDEKELLTIARSTLERHLKGQEIHSIRSENSRLQISGGAFVTLHRHGDLRGCIGHLVSNHPIFETVREMAVAAATQDPRFPPVALDELPDLDIEISVLSPFSPLKDTGEIQVGRHGLVVSRGGHRGLLLPQVAEEYGWDAETFLAHTCYKAGLPFDAWRDPATKIEIFSAQVFGEKD